MAKLLYGRGTNWTKMTTSKLKEITSHPHFMGSDGKDYYPYKDELIAELWRRQAVEDEKTLKRWEIEFKNQLKAQNTKKEKSA